MKTTTEMVNEIVELSQQICARYDDMIQRNKEMIAESAQYVEMCLWSMQASAEEIRALNKQWGI